MSFEQIMVNDNSNQFNYAHEDSSSIDSTSNHSFHESEAQNHRKPCKQSRDRLKSNIKPPIIQTSDDLATNSNPEIQQLQIELLKRQIEVQELKIERTRQLMKMEVAKKFQNDYNHHFHENIEINHFR